MLIPVVSFVKGSTKYIIVKGNLSKEDIEKFIKEIITNCRLDISFNKTDYLPLEIVESLSNLTNVAVTTDSKELKGYLRKLGIKTKIVINNKGHLKITKIKIEDEELNRFLKAIFEKYGYDFTNYSKGTIKRRIQASALSISINNFEEFSNIILNGKENFKYLFENISINVTEFFREPKELKRLKETVLPYLNSYSHIKIWCAGCSSGESPYSMAIILHEAGMLEKSQIYATDFNNRVLQEAKNGLFSFDNLSLYIDNYKKSGGTGLFSDYFTKNNKYLKIKDYIRQKIVYFNHNLITDNVMNEFQLIVCKNVMIYFDKQLKQRVLQLFDDSLCCNGFLVIGKSEFLNQSWEKRFKSYKQNSRIFQKVCR